MKKASLGSTTKTASLLGSDQEKNRIIERYYLQSLARELMPEHRVCVCCKFMSHDAENVKIVFRASKKTASYKGLARCSSIWVCPVCGAVISEQRKSELKRATNSWDGKILMVSYTIRHNFMNILEDSLKLLKASFKNFLSGSYGEDFRVQYGVIGTVRAIEVTYGKNGWHVHIHQLIFCRDFELIKGIEYPFDLADLTDELKKRWVVHVRKNGGNATYQNGLDIKESAEFVADYISKFGRPPKNEIWSVEHELAKANSKRAKNGGKSPIELLMAYGDGDKRSGQLFREFALAFFGERQLIWSKGLKDILGVDVLTDEETMQKEENDGNFIILATLTIDEWKRVIKGNLQGFILSVALDGDAQKLEDFLISNYIRSAKND